MGFQLVVKHTFLEFHYEEPSPRVQGRRTRAWTDADIPEPRRHDVAVTHCKTIGSKVPEAAAALAAATAEEAAALAADFADYGFGKSFAAVTIREDSTEASTEAVEACEAAAANIEAFTEASTSSATKADAAEAHEAPVVDIVDIAATNELKALLGIRRNFAMPIVSMPEPVALDGTRTTVMLRNLPKNCTCSKLLDLVDSLGFSGHYDFACLPVDFSTGAGLGYAFVNLISARAVPAFWARIAGFRERRTTRGHTARVERYRNSPT